MIVTANTPLEKEIVILEQQIICGEAKGQWISAAKYQVFPSSKKPTKFCTCFCPSL